MDEPRWINRLTWAFVALGILLRIGRYAINFPLWWDEAFVGVNLLHRGYLDLLRPLDYGQVCPLLFVWIELTAVKIFGFSEWSLRLFPIICGVASVPLFLVASGQMMRGLPRLYATALFAVSFYPIRHSADVKPYASDLLAALVLITLALSWLRTKNRRWLWAMAGFGPIAVALSYPAIFVAGGIGIALIPSVWNEGRTARISLAVFGIFTIATFLALFAVFTQGQASATLPAMQSEWVDSFPPWQQPLSLLFWLVTTHTGDLFAYPFGASRLASTLIFGLFVIAVVGFWRHEKIRVAVCVSPFVLGMIAAAAHRYPYGGSAHGGSARFMQYLAPSICLLAGLGASMVLNRIRSPQRRTRSLLVGVVGLAAAGIVPVVIDLPHPYRAIQAQKSRQFAREFWPTIGPAKSLRGDVAVAPWESIHLNVPVAICNQEIYTPSRNVRIFGSFATTETFVLVDAHPDEDVSLENWLDSMKKQNDLIQSRTIVVDVGEPGGRKQEERYRVFDFVPKRIAQQTETRK